MTKTYNTPKRNHIVKTRLDDEEHADFLRRLEIYDMNQSEFIREAISGATIKPTIVATFATTLTKPWAKDENGNRSRSVNSFPSFHSKFTTTHSRIYDT